MLKANEILARKLLDIENSCHEIKDISFNNSVEKFLDDITLQHAVLRNIEIIGEATRGVIPYDRASKSAVDRFGVLADYSEVPWQKLIGARERIIHGYDSIDFEIVCGIMEEKIPELLDCIQRMRRDNPGLSQMMDEIKKARAFERAAHIAEVKKLHSRKDPEEK